MKKILIYIVVSVIVFGLSLSISANNITRIQKEENTIQKFNHQSTTSIGTYNFPLTVNSFFEDLGRPDTTFTDDNESCPVGQIHTWCLNSQNFKVLVLGDHYRKNVNYSADTRIFAVAKCDTDKTTEFNGLWGIRFGDSDKEVIEKLSQIVKKNRNSNLKTNIKGKPIHVFLNDFSVSHHHTLQKGESFFYFVMNKKGNLEIIVQSSFDISVAC